MKSRYGIFQCNKCEKEVGHNVVIAQDQGEFDKLSKALIPPFAEFSVDTLVKQFKCIVEGCDGFINVIYVETDY
jgi:hypothetical protein